MREDEINEEVTKNNNTEDARIVGDGEKIEGGEEVETVVKIGEVLPSQKRRTITGRYVLKISGKDVPEDATLDDLEAILVRRVLASTRKLEEAEVQEQVTESEESTHIETSESKEDGKKRGRAVGIIGIALVGAALTATIGSCTAKMHGIDPFTYEVEYTREIKDPFTLEYVEVEPPQEIATGITGIKGQEGLTDNIIEDNESLLNGDNYIASDHAQDEADSIEGYEQNIESQGRVKEGMNKLADKKTTDEEAEKIIDSIHDETEVIHEQYEQISDLVDQGSKTFEERARKHKDDRTEGEINVIKHTVERYHDSQQQVRQDLSDLEDLQGKLREGQELEIESVTHNERTGEYIITGNTVETVVVKQRFTGIRAVWENFRNWVRGITHSRNIDQNR